MAAVSLSVSVSLSLSLSMHHFFTDDRLTLLPSHDHTFSCLRPTASIKTRSFFRFMYDRKSLCMVASSGPRTRSSSGDPCSRALARTTHDFFKTLANLEKISVLSTLIRTGDAALLYNRSSQSRRQY